MLRDKSQLAKLHQDILKHIEEPYMKDHVTFKAEEAIKKNVFG